MKFIIKNAEGQECGPYELKEIEQFLLEGRVDGGTMIRTALLDKWSRIDKVEQLAKTLAAAQERIEPNPDKRKKNLQEEIEVDTTFRNRSIPVPAGAIMRLCSALIDGVILAALAGIILLSGLIQVHFSASSSTVQAPPPPPPAKEKATGTDRAERKNIQAPQADKAAQPALPTATVPDVLPDAAPVDNRSATTMPSNHDDETRGYRFGSVWKIPAQNLKLVCVSARPGQARWIHASTADSVIRRTLVLLLFAFLLYYGLSLGLTAQTAGMWFWGLFIVRKSDGGEVYMLRAFLFSLMMLPFGLLTPFLALLPGHWAIHDLIAGVRVQRTVPRSRY